MASARGIKKKKDEAKPRCSGTMTEAQYLAWIRSALRSKWLRWPPRAEALKAAQVPYKGDNARRKYSYKCAMCNGLFAQKEVEVDHYPLEAGSILSVADIGAFVNRLYCEANNLRVVCKPCHKAHTLAESQGISLEEAKALKQAIEWAKKPKKEVVAFLEERGYNADMAGNASKRREALVEIFLKENQSG